MAEYEIARRDQASGATEVWPIDLAARLGSGETITAVTAALYAGIATGAPLSPAPSAVGYAGTVVHATVAGLSPTVGFYRLRFLVTTSAGRTTAADLLLSCLT